MISPLGLEQALSARDSLAKAIYGRAFTWLVQKLNQSLAFKVCFFFLSMRTVPLLYLSGLFCQNVISHMNWSLGCFLGFDVPSSGVIIKNIIFLCFYRMKSTTPVNVLLLLVCWTYMDLRSFNTTGSFDSLSHSLTEGIVK